jgi:hypothetical protein
VLAAGQRLEKLRQRLAIGKPCSSGCAAEPSSAGGVQLK